MIISEDYHASISVTSRSISLYREMYINPETEQIWPLFALSRCLGSCHDSPVEYAIIYIHIIDYCQSLGAFTQIGITDEIQSGREILSQPISSYSKEIAT